MPDLSPLLVGVLACVAAWTTVGAIVGRVAWRVPRCRQCGTDVRGFAWRTPLRCDCGADLAAPRAVGWARRRSRRLAAGAVLCTLASVVLAAWTITVRANGNGWRDELPLWAYAQLLAWDLDDATLTSLQRRLNEGASADDAARLRDALLASGRQDRMAATLYRLGALAVPTGDDGERFMQFVIESIDVVAIDTPEAIELIPRSRDVYSGDVREVLLRIDAIEIDGGPVPFTAITGRSNQRAPEGKGNPTAAPTAAPTAEPPRLWRPLGESTSATRYLVSKRDLPPSLATPHLDPSRIRLVGQAAFAGAALDTIVRDARIATSSQPATWGVAAAQSFFERVACPLPGSPERERREEPPDWTVRWWGELQGRPMLPAIAARPVLAMAGAGAAFGAGCAAAWLVTRALARGPRRWIAPHCDSCGSMLRGRGDALPERCPECGMAIAGIDACRCVTIYGKRLRRVLMATLGVGSIAFVASAATTGFVSISTLYADRFISPEAEAAWLVEATIHPPPFAFGPDPSNRLIDGALDLGRSSNTIYQPTSPSLGRAAADAFATWWAAGAELPQAPTDPTGRWRRERIHIAVHRLSEAGAMDRSLASAIVGWCLDPAIVPPPLSVPLLVRAGGSVTPTLHQAGNSIVARAAGTTAWNPPRLCHLPVPAQVGLTTLDYEWASLIPGAQPSRSQEQPLAPLPPAPAMPPLLPDGDPPVLSAPRSVRAPALVIAADAPQAVTGPELEELARSVQVGLVVQPCGERSAIELAQPMSFHATRWIGRWEVLASDGPDAAILATLTRDPSGPAPRTLATLPLPLPTELVLRFVPELPPSSYTSPGTGEPLWGQPTTFRLSRRADQIRPDARVAIYATDACPVLRW